MQVMRWRQTVLVMRIQGQSWTLMQMCLQLADIALSLVTQEEELRQALSPLKTISGRHPSTEELEARRQETKALVRGIDFTKKGPVLRKR